VTVPNQLERQLMQELRSAGWVKATAAPRKGCYPGHAKTKARPAEYKSRSRGGNQPRLVGAA
jgi:hypothetical protein